MIEQAIFTSARTTLGNGYHLVAKSPGVSTEIAAELAVWGPSHGSLCVEHEDAASVNYHRLAGGQYCVSKTLASGEEYSERGGARIYTHFLILSDNEYARFAYLPFAVLRAAWAKGLLDVAERLPTSLDAFNLAGRTATVDEGLLAQMADEVGPTRTARLLTAALEPGVKLIEGLKQPELAFAGLLNCLPVKCRGDVSFTTGLRFSPRRPFRLGLMEASQDERRRVSRQEDVTLVDLHGDESSAAESHAWAALVADLMADDLLPVLASELQSPAALDISNDEQLLEFAGQLRRKTNVLPRSADDIGSPRVEPADRGERQTRSTRAAPGKAKTPVVAAAPRAARAAGHAPRRGAQVAAPTLVDLGSASAPEAVELVEQLDDAVYGIINGAVENRELAEELWTQLSETLPATTVSKLREQYLRYTLNLWESCLDGGMRDPNKAAGALEVLSLLFDRDRK